MQKYNYVHFVFIYKSPCKILIYWPIIKILSSTYIVKQQGYDMV